MRRRRLPSQEIPENPQPFEVSSLVDVGFLLLIFFLVTSSIQKRETQLETRVPSDQSARPTVETLVVELAIAPGHQSPTQSGSWLQARGGSRR